MESDPSNKLKIYRTFLRVIIIDCVAIILLSCLLIGLVLSRKGNVSVTDIAQTIALTSGVVILLQSLLGLPLFLVLVFSGRWPQAVGLISATIMGIFLSFLTCASVYR